MFPFLSSDVTSQQPPKQSNSAGTEKFQQINAVCSSNKL